MKKLIYIFGIFIVTAIILAYADWQVDGFDFFKVQDYQFYFQTWISFGGAIFAFIMSATTFILYKKSDIVSLKFVSISFSLISIAYMIIGYHTSYCKMCSDLSLCGASHNYPNFFILISLIIFILTLLLVDTKLKISLIKIFSYGLITATSLLMVVLFMSINYIEIPDIVPYILTNANFQGFIFIFPLLFTILTFLYFKSTYKITPIISGIFLLIFLSFIPQAYHIFTCTECNNMECSEFFIASGIFMFMAIGSILYSINLQLKSIDSI